MRNRPRKRDPFTANIDILFLATQCLAQAIRSIVISVLLSLYLAYQAAKGLLIAFGGCLRFTLHVLRALPILLIASALIPVASCALFILCMAIVWDEVQRLIVASVHQLTATMLDRIRVHRNKLEEYLRYISNSSLFMSISTNMGFDSGLLSSSTPLTNLDSSLHSRNPYPSSFSSPHKHEYRHRRQSVSSLKTWTPTLSPVPSVSGSVSGSSRAPSLKSPSRNTTLGATLERPCMDHDRLPLMLPLPVKPLHDDYDSGAETDLEHSHEVKEQFWRTTRIPSPKSDRQFISLARMKSEIGVGREYLSTGGLKSLVPMSLRTTTTAKMPLCDWVD